MSSARLALGVALVLAAGPWGCGDDDGVVAGDAGGDAGGPVDATPPPLDTGPPPPDDGGSPPPADTGAADPLADFCTRGAMIECAGNQRCCATPYPSPGECVDAQAAACRSDLGALFAANPGLHLDPARIEAFFDFVQTASERCGGPAPDIGLLPLAGTVGVGGDCTQTSPDDLALFRCAEGLACAIDFTARRGSCATAPVSGGTCTNPYMCPIGERCTADFEATPVVPGTCEALLVDGVPCARAEDCRGGACTGGACALRAQDFCLGR